MRDLSLLDFSYLCVCLFKVEFSKSRGGLRGGSAISGCHKLPIANDLFRLRKRIRYSDTLLRCPGALFNDYQKIFHSVSVKLTHCSHSRGTPSHVATFELQSTTKLQPWRLTSKPISYILRDDQFSHPRTRIGRRGCTASRMSLQRRHSTNHTLRLKGDQMPPSMRRRRERSADDRDTRRCCDLVAIYPGSQSVLAVLKETRSMDSSYRPIHNEPLSSPLHSASHQVTYSL